MSGRKHITELIYTKALFCPKHNEQNYTSRCVPSECNFWDVTANYNPVEHLPWAEADSEDSTIEGERNLRPQWHNGVDDCNMPGAYRFLPMDFLSCNTVISQHYITHGSGSKGKV